MTAAPARLPHPDDPVLRCASCHALTPATGGLHFTTPIGIRHRRHCHGCGAIVVSLEVVASRFTIASLPVPARTPAIVLRWCARLARVGAWVAR